MELEWIYIYNIQVKYEYKILYYVWAQNVDLFKLVLLIRISVEMKKET